MENQSPSFSKKGEKSLLLTHIALLVLAFSRFFVISCGFFFFKVLSEHLKLSNLENVRTKF